MQSLREIKCDIRALMAKIQSGQVNDQQVVASLQELIGALDDYELQEQAAREQLVMEQIDGGH